MLCVHGDGGRRGGAKYANAIVLHYLHFQSFRIVILAPPVLATLDMQLPTLLLGDFNGTVTPARDHHLSRQNGHAPKGDGTVCPLLARLVGPGGPFSDLQMVVSPELFAPTFHSSHVDLTNWSRCDLALGNRAALGLVARVSALLTMLHWWRFRWKRAETKTIRKTS